jgi:uncharacterized protein (TIGR03083 family)
MRTVASPSHVCSAIVTFEDYVAAWHQASASLLDVCEQLPDTDWAAATECPGWSVKDVVAHVTGVEAMLLGRPRPKLDGPVDAPYIRNDLGRMVEVDVQARRPLPPAAVLAELREVLAERHRSLRESPPDPDAPTVWIQGPTTMTGMMRLRVFDVWAHEQDIRRATDRPGDLAGPAADVTRDVILASLPKAVAKLAGAPPDSVVALTVTGATSFAVAVGVDGNRRGALLASPWPQPATSTLTLDWVELVRLACGRVDPATAAVRYDADVGLGRRVAAALGITP